MKPSFANPESDLARLIIGTAAFGQAYGLSTRPCAGSEQVDAIVQLALEQGVATFDTAPAYGTSETLLGEALGSRGSVWTKVGSDGVVADSLARLRREQLDVVQWHNLTRTQLTDPSVCTMLQRLRENPAVARLGATTYGVQDALAAVNSGLFDVVQVEWNVLNQGVVAAVERDGDPNVALAVRSVLLQGVLTEDPLASHLHALTESRERAVALAETHGISLYELAVGAARAHARIDWVLVGVRSAAELAGALAVPRLSSAAGEEVRDLDVYDRDVTDPRRWPAPG